MDYNAIFKRSWEVVKREKVLWVYGMILAAFGGSSSGGGGGGNYSNVFRLFDNQDKLPTPSGEKVSQVLGAMTANPGEFFASLIFGVPAAFWLALVLGVLVSGLFFLILNFFMVSWSTGALFGLAGKESVTLRLGALLGLKGWKRLLGIQLTMLGIFLLLIVGGLVLVPFFLIDNTAWRVLLVVALVAYIFFSVAFGIFMRLWEVFSTLVVTAEDLPMGKALSASWHLAKRYLWPGIFLGFLHLAITILIGIAIGVGALVTLGILGLVVAGIFFLNRTAGIVAAILVGTPAIFLISCAVLLSGIYKAFASSNWVQFYAELKKREDWMGV